ncbi:MAG: WGR domain-containing protein [Candidatus Thorarchaeota archaeon]|jgi:predicted DNA-binding WGR domain protein
MTVSTSGRYEFKNEHEHKFWEVSIEEKIVTLRFGKVGTSGHRASREFTSAESAREFLEMRRQKKIKEGYIPVDSTSAS